MKEQTLSGLSKLHSIVRLCLLASLVFFLIGLFALVSRWDSAIPIIVFACVFRLAAVGLARRKYNAAWMQASTTAAAESKYGPVTYNARETAPQTLVTDLGFAPDVLLAPGTFLFHVLRGTLEGHPFRLAETAFVRLSENGKKAQGRSVAGTLITVENALPASEKWVLLKDHALDGFCPLTEYSRSAWKPAGALINGTACFTDGEETESPVIAAKVLRRMLDRQGAVLAAADGNLSLLIPGSFYACKPELAKAPTEEALNRTVLPAPGIMQDILAALRSRK